jgi:hypothetical protein
MLADGYEPKHVAEKLGVDVRSLNGLLDSPVARQLSDVERLQLIFRNAWVQFELERGYQQRINAELAGVFDPSNSKHVRLQESARHCGLCADKHLKTALDAADKIRALGGGDILAGRVVHIPVPGAPEVGDLTHGGDGEGPDDDADQ